MEKNGGGLEKDERTILGIVAAFPGADGRVNFGLAAIQSHGLLDLPPQQFGRANRCVPILFYLENFIPL